MGPKHQSYLPIIIRVLCLILLISALLTFCSLFFINTGYVILFILICNFFIISLINIIIYFDSVSLEKVSLFLYYRNVCFPFVFNKNQNRLEVIPALCPQPFTH